MRARILIALIGVGGVALAGLALAADAIIISPDQAAARPSSLELAARGRLSNLEAPVPPQCYTRTFGTFNPCYTCHQTYPGFERPNHMSDADLQAAYSFSEVGETNHWSNLFVDRQPFIEATPDEEILAWIAGDNYSDLRPRLEAAGWPGWLPDLDNLQLGAAAFEPDGFAKDGSGWVAFNYKPLPSTFWPTNGSTDDVMIRLPEPFRVTAAGVPSKDVYRANLALVEIAIQDLPSVTTLPLDESVVGEDLDRDGQLGMVERVVRQDHYVGGASDVAVAHMLYPEGTQFLHGVRYVGIEDGAIVPSTRLKELRYMQKIRFLDNAQLRTLYGNEHQEKTDGRLPKSVDTGAGLSAGFGWLVLGFIEDADGALRPQTYEEQQVCMGCHSTVGATIDQTFAFPRKVTGAEGWGYIDLHGMPDAPSVGGERGEILTYLERVGGGSEFRENDEMQARWFDADGEVLADAVRAADVYTLITPSPQRALALNKAYLAIVREQSFVYGRDAILHPARNVYAEVDPETAPTLPEDRQFDYDIRLDWGGRSAF